jgi:hypothetical protein
MTGDRAQKLHDAIVDHFGLSELTSLVRFDLVFGLVGLVFRIRVKPGEALLSGLLTAGRYVRALTSWVARAGSPRLQNPPYRRSAPAPPS